MSPMGEPFVSQNGEDGLTLWFRQADRNHDGFITQDEMRADAQRFFTTLDTDHDGEIDPDETAHYEQIIAPEVRTGLLSAPQTLAADGSRQGASSGGRRGSHHGGGRHYGAAANFDAGLGGGDDEARAGRFGLLQIPEPITSADADFNRGVSAVEFQNAAAERFRLLDINHSGRLTLPELQNIRQAATSASRRSHPTQSSPDDAPPLDPGDNDGDIAPM